MRAQRDVVSKLNKLTAYEDLVADRKQCRLCERCGVTNPATVGGGFDSEEIGPWTRWQGNLNAKLMIVGQDWGDVRYFKANDGKEKPGNPTNETLRELIGLLGLEVGSPGELGRDGVAFFTNAVLCLKETGGLQGSVSRSWFDNCKPFLKRQIEIVAPRLVVCLGESAYRAVATAFNFRTGAFREAVESEEGIQVMNETRLFARYHCGRRIQNTHRSLAQQREDWLRLVKFL